VKALVLAAGKGTRMRSDLAKVLHQAAGRPLVRWVLDAAAAAGCDDIVVVVGHQAAAVEAILPGGVTTALQEEQHGTGHAAQIGLAALDPSPGDEILVLPGDMPLIRPSTLRTLIATHRRVGAAATLLSVVDGPRDYGRVVRHDGAVVAIVEARDAGPEEVAIREVNTSVYVFDAGPLAAALATLRPDNDQGELYLTDVIGVLSGQGLPLAAVPASPEEALGVNSVDQLAVVDAALRRRTPDPTSG
jgi:bifunctional UDP-N-acetylglucosamine pyrophosphorylase/glucosamine-1-phosphate N-acetyltransferase